MCDKHNKEIKGSVCDEDYCEECSKEYQATLTGPFKMKSPFIEWREFHGKIIWVIDGTAIEPSRT